MPRLLFFCLLLFVLGCKLQTSESDRSENPTINLEEITIDQIQLGYQNGEFTIVELVQAYLDRIEAIDINGPALNSIIELNPDALENCS